MSHLPTFYQILGVLPSATKEEIRDAYWELARKNHPDVAGVENTAKFTKITGAYATLSDSKKKSDYMKKLRLHLRECPKCKGEGVRYSTRNKPTTCAECSGAGFTEK